MTAAESEPHRSTTDRVDIGGGAPVVVLGDVGAAGQEGIGDTIRVSLTPRPGGDRREEVHACRELLQALGLRAFAPSVTACSGCGRTTSTTFHRGVRGEPISGQGLAAAPAADLPGMSSAMSDPLAEARSLEAACGRQR